MPASRPAPSRRSASATRSTSPSAPATATACGPAAPPARSTSSAPPKTQSRALRSGARPARGAAIALHQPPQGYFHAADDAALFAAVLQPARAASASSRSRSSSTTSRSSARTAATSRSAATPASTSVRPRRSAATRRQGQDRPAGHHGQSEPVRRLRRLHDRVPDRRADLRHAAPERAGTRIRTLLVDLRARRRTRRRAAVAQPGRRRRRWSRSSAARRASIDGCRACRRA